MKMMMPGIDEFPDAPDPLVDGEYDFQSSGYELKTAKDGRQYFRITGEFLSGPYATAASGDTIDYEGRQFSFTVWPPQAQDGEFIEGRKRKFKEFLKAGNIPWDDEGYDPDDFVGAQWRLLLGPQKNNPQYQEVKKFVEL